MADAPKLVGTDTLRIAYPKINQAIDNANKALSGSDGAVLTANQAKTTAESVQDQFNEVVIEGAIDPETAQARVDSLGNTSTTLKDRVDKQQYFLNVKALGAVGDGVANDAVKIQSALDLANGLITVFFPKGTYGVNQTITIPNNTSILAEQGAVIKALSTFTGTVKTITFESSSYSNYPVLYALNPTNLSIEGLTVDGNAANNPNNNVSCILIENGSKMYFNRVKTINNKSIDSASYSGGAFFFNGGSDARLIDCEVDNIVGEGLHLRNFSHAYIRGGEYQNSTSSVIGTQYGSHVTIEGVKAHNANKSVISLNSTDSKVLNSTVYESATYGGIILGHRTTYETRKPADRSIVSNNKIHNCYAGGVIVQYGKDLIISDNQVHDCNGAYTAADSAYMLGGIDASNWANGVTIVNNQLRNNNRGIYVKGARVDSVNLEYTYGEFIIKNNKVTYNKLSGIQVNDCRYGAIVSENMTYANNIENLSARAEILINFDYSTSNTEWGAIIVKDNLVGNPKVISYRGIAVSYSGTLTTLTYPVVIEGNSINNTSTSPVNSSLGYKNTIIRKNTIEGKVDEFDRVDISDATSTIDIGYAKFIRLMASTAFNLTTINSKHGVGAEIVIQANAAGATLKDNTGNLWLNGDYVVAANSVIILKWTGGAWIELSRVNT